MSTLSTVNDLENRLLSLNVTAVSQDGEIRARARGPEDITVEVAGNSFRSYSERSLEYQLDRLAAALWARYHCAYLDSAHDYVRPVDDSDPVAEELADLSIHGWSTQRTVTVVTCGLVDWNFHIADGTVARLRCVTLGDEITSAARSAIGYFGAYSSKLRRRRARSHAVPLNLDAWQEARLW